MDIGRFEQNLQLDSDKLTLADCESSDLVLKRHDNHNLELKTHYEFDLPIDETQVEFYFFTPTSVRLRESNKEQIYSDLYSRIRLFLPMSRIRLSTSVNELIEDIKNLITQAKIDGLSLDDIEDTLVVNIQNLGGFLGESIKAHSRSFRKDLLLTFSKTHRLENSHRIIEDLKVQLDEIFLPVFQVRSWLKEEQRSDYWLYLWLHEYLYFLMIESLSKIQKDLKLIQSGLTNQKVYQMGCQELNIQISLIRESELKHARQVGLSVELGKDIIEEELLVRLGQMKKFFQSKMFIEVDRKPPIKKFTEPMAALAAVVAGVSGSLVQQFGSPQYFQMSIQGFSIIFIGIAAYVLRDRLKDLIRDYFSKRISNFIPDYEYELKDDKKYIGRIFEFLKIEKASRLSDDLKLLRKKIYVSKAESFLNEDVMVLRRRYIWPNKKNRATDQDIFLQETLRLNVERHLRFLDDPFKNITFLDSKGLFATRTTNKIYYFYSIIRMRSSVLGKHGLWKNHTYRVVINKNGIQKVIPIT